jgi:hypothetical protein
VSTKGETDGVKNRWTLPLVIGCLAVAAGLGWVWLSQRQPSRPVAPSDSPVGQQSGVDFSPLVGKWRRPDGGYVIEISAVDASGAVTARYLNPRPIHVARAEAAVAGQALRLDLELQDVGYPGATYALVFNRNKEVLVGFYHQPAAGQMFDVMFVRMP